MLSEAALSLLHNVTGLGWDFEGGAKVTELRGGSCPVNKLGIINQMALVKRPLVAQWKTPFENEANDLVPCYNQSTDYTFRTVMEENV